jgi:hypothetical protein
MRRLRVYISGPITKGSRNDNFYQAAKAEEFLMRAGYAPLNPMRSMLMPHAWQDDLPHNLWLSCDLPWVEVADIVYRLPGESAGADEECDHAKSRGIPVVGSLNELRHARYELEQKEVA